MSEFSRDWSAEVLRSAPLIAPARHYLWPMQIAGEEDALARGALQVMVRPRTGSAYLLTCALGFKDPAMPSGVFACPNTEEICAIAGGYAYIAPAAAPWACTLLPVKPVTAVLPVVDQGLLLFAGFTSILAWGRQGQAWQTGRLSWEGIRIVSVGDGELIGFGWDLMADVEVEFRVNLRTGTFVGGGWRG